MNSDMKMKTIYKIFAVLLAAVLLTACDEHKIDVEDLLTPRDSTKTEEEGLKLQNVTFSENHKYMTIYASVVSDFGGYDLTDKLSVESEVNQEWRLIGGPWIKEKSAPILKEVRNIGRDEVAKQGLKLLVLVDLSIPQEMVDRERAAVKEMKTIFDRQNLYLAFMQGNSVSETYEATDYVIDNFFEHKDPAYVYLYRSVLMKIDEMESGSASFFADAKYKVIVILSGGKTYEDDTPIDPEHFELQNQLTDRVENLHGKMLFYYSNFNDSVPPSGQYDANIMQYLCKDMAGLYLEKFNWNTIEEDIKHDFGIDYSDYMFVLEMPSRKVFRGNRHKIELTFLNASTKQKIVSGSTYFYLGSLYDPVIIDADPLFDVILQGLLLAAFMLIFIYVVLQFVEPYIRYHIFLKRHVITYQGKQMSYDGQMIAESCYFCKAPFESGDELVKKCKHTMHLSCWEENEYHCPEYGRHCPDGSHYYNRHNLWDRFNASFYMKWILMALFAGFIAWVFFLIRDHDMSGTIIRKTVILLNGLEEGSSEVDKMFNEYGAHLNKLPGFGFDVSFWLTLCLSYLTVCRRHWFYRTLELLGRSLCAAILGYFVFLLGCAISIALHIDSNPLLIDWIPWALMSWLIMLSVTLFTRIHIRKLFLVIACLVGLLSMYLWALLYSDSRLDYRAMLLFTFVAYSVGIALCIARLAPRSERFFLHVEGAIKEMDIALYKWLKNDPKSPVTIGKSVDCNIQTSWDINGNVAPLQAEIRRYRNSLRLYAFEEGVFVNGRPLPVGKECWIYHGRSFTIGNTTFTYIEKDI